MTWDIAAALGVLALLVGMAGGFALGKWRYEALALYWARRFQREEQMRYASLLGSKKVPGGRIVAVQRNAVGGTGYDTLETMADKVRRLEAGESLDAVCPADYVAPPPSFKV